MRPCVEPGCSALVPRGRCPQHAVAQEQQRHNYAVRRLYRTARWRRMRAWVLTHVDPLCRACAQHDQVTPSTEVDHIVPHRGDEAEFWDWNNVQGLCASCHGAKTQRGE